MLWTILTIIALFALYLVVIFFVAEVRHDSYLEEEKEKREKRLASIPLNERKCSNNCKYARNVKQYKRGNQNLIGAECTCNSYEMINGFYVKGKGDGAFVWEKDHIGCKEYDHPFASFL